VSEDRLVELDAEVVERRREVEERLERLRTALASEVGFAPRRRGWLLALVAGAAGIAVALRRRRQSRASTGAKRGRRRR
jgi:hypothetical protein